jgi:hypothetical protein
VSSAVDYQVETYVEQDIPEHLQSDRRVGPEGSGATDGSTERDTRLLKVLYDGQAITSVHDHAFLEPGVAAARGARDKITLSASQREHIAQMHDRAVANLVTSARSYDVDAGGGVDVAAAGNSRFGGFRSGPGGRARAEVDSENRFGGFTSLGAEIGGVSSSASSLTILAGLRAAASSSSSSSSSSSASSSSAFTERPITSVPSAAHSSLEENMERRLLALFHSSASSSSHGAAARGLTTDFLLGKFRDVGDQYAPLFRDLLRKVAILREGKWYLRR